MSVTYTCDHCGAGDAHPQVNMPIINSAGTLNWTRVVQLCAPCVHAFLAMADAFLSPEGLGMGDPFYCDTCEHWVEDHDHLRECAREALIPVIFAGKRGSHAYHVRSLEDGTEAIVISEPYKMTRQERWSWKSNRVVTRQAGE